MGGENENREHRILEMIGQGLLKFIELLSFPNKKYHQKTVFNLHP